MSYQSEDQLEKSFITQLNALGFSSVSIKDAQDLHDNLKTQLDRFNQTQFSDTEFQRIFNHLQKGDRFDKAKTLRDRFLLQRDDGTDSYIRFFNMEQWCKNEYQVTHQISQVGRHVNRYDVTLLINGLPAVQIELKRRGVEMKEAFNQIQRYHKDSFTGTLFEYVQIFVISNGVNTKYFANNPKQSFEQTIYWTDAENQKITQLDAFTDAFLEKCMVSEMIAEYIVLNETRRIPMILRPYQYYAAQAIAERVEETNKNGYIWHTTGSGKTLTSFKVSQILSKNPEVSKVLFVVDRKDLDIQTTKEFNSFSPGAVDGTDKTKTLVNQLRDPNRNLIVTTIQKLDRAISREKYLEQLSHLTQEPVVIIFDECHRSQFGQTHARIRDFFQQAQLFGFTGTPIFADNNVGGVTTADVFDTCLHRYTITNAIADNNVLGFSVEYVGRYKQRQSDIIDVDIDTDPWVKGVDTKEVLESRPRLEKITTYILDDWKRKTKDGKFNALFAISRVEVLKQYYSLFREYKPEDFTIATIFTSQANEDESPDLLDVDVFSTPLPEKADSRDFLEGCIEDYNQTFQTNFSTEGFYEYYQDVQKRIKNKEIDLILVVNMFLTGFDSPTLNTLYLDKNLRYHGLIQAYSRTNRIHSVDKPHGNIISFRNLKEETDKALALFGDEKAQEVVFRRPYEEQKQDFEDKLTELREIAPTVADTDGLVGEEQTSEFVKTFRDLLRIKASLETFAGFSFQDLGIDEQEFYDYQSKYLDVHEDRKSQETQKESILDDIDFELELTAHDTINFDYIIFLICGLKEHSSEDMRQQKRDDLLKTLDRNPDLRKKKDLIQKFIDEHLPDISDTAQVEQAFSQYWAQQRHQQVQDLAQQEHIPEDNLLELIQEYLYSQKLPREQDIADMIPPENQPRITERSTILGRIKNAITNIVDVFEW